MVVNEDNFQEVLKELLELSNETQRTVAKKAGVHFNTILRWLKGGSYPNLPQLCWVLTALGKHLEVRDNKNHSGRQRTVSWKDDVKEPTRAVIQARWLKNPTGFTELICSNCGGDSWYYDANGRVEESPFCPNCGAKMNLEESK